MASITKEFLIEMLIPYPKDDLDKGFNAAIIQILKIGTIMAKEQLGESTTQIDPNSLRPGNEVSSYLQKKIILKRAFDTIGVIDTNGFIDDKNKVIEYFNLLANNKLAAIKYLKETAVLGLKEAKEITDKIQIV